MRAYRGERGDRRRLTECQAARANAGTLASRLVLSGAGTAERNGACGVSEGASPAVGQASRLSFFDGPPFRWDEDRTGESPRCVR